ncbi:uncharacterized protein LOC143056034 isoform X1 [Mytilus galloprovincialis]|uniref:uncharacterized protein LOC143056034 isoform X1 n=1 Tax=Mytilus galloprovincialis TaxID=29158 RepID=UPI003F7C7C71
MTEQQGQPSQSQTPQQSQPNQQQQQPPAVSQPAATNVTTQSQTVQPQTPAQNVQQPTQQLQHQTLQQQVHQVQQVQQTTQPSQQPQPQQQQQVQHQQIQPQQVTQQQTIQNLQQVQQGQMQATSCGTPNLIQTGNQFTQATTMTTGLRTPGIPQVQVIPQLHSPPYQISQFPYNQQQIMLQNAMQAAMQASAMNMNMTPQQQLNMSMAMAMQGRPSSVSGMNSPGLMSPSPTTPTQQLSMNFATSVQNLVTNAVAQNVTAKSRQTTGTVQAQATALVAGKPIMPTQAMPGTPIVLGQLSVLPNQVGNNQGFVTSKGQTFSVAVANNGQQMLTSQAGAFRLSQPQVVSSTGQILNSQPLYTNQAMLQAMANLQQQAAFPLATNQQLLSGTGQSQAILSGQQLFIRAANPLQPQGIITGIQNLGQQVKDGKTDTIQGLQGKATVAGVIGKQVVGSQVGKTMITPLNKTATARINPTMAQRPRISIPNLPKNPNRGRPRNQSKGAPVAMATASTNTVASALSQARATGALSQSKPATPVHQMNQAILLKSQSDSEVETSKKNINAEMGKKLNEDKKEKPDSIEKKDNVVIEKQKAIVKPHILTHVIEGFVIQEGPEPFPVSEVLVVREKEGPKPFPVQRSSLLTEFIPPKPGLVPMDTDSGSAGMSSSPVQSPKKVEHKEPPAVFEKCEFCGTEEQMAKFSKRSKRFCSMICAKRYNVAHRISMLKQRGRGTVGRPPLGGRYMRKRGKPLNLRKGWRPGRGGRLSYNTNSKTPGEIGMKENQFDQEEMSNSSLSDSSSTPDSPPPPRQVQTHSETDMETDIPKSHPSKWNVVEVYEFIKVLPGCGPYAEEFRSQEIDGQALMLLKEDHLMTTMSMKLGPALKICAKINSLREGHD